MNTLLYTISMLHTINTINTAFPSHTIVQEYSPTHLHVSVSILELIHAPIVKWKYSKSPDMLYCEELSQYYMETLIDLTGPTDQTDSIDQILHLNYNSEQKQFEIYEGVHHFIALRILYNKYSTELNHTINVNIDIKMDKTTQELMAIREDKDMMNGWCM